MSLSQTAFGSCVRTPSRSRAIGRAAAVSAPPASSSIETWTMLRSGVAMASLTRGCAQPTDKAAAIAHMLPKKRANARRFQFFCVILNLSDIRVAKSPKSFGGRMAHFKALTENGKCFWTYRPPKRTIFLAFSEIGRGALKDRARQKQKNAVRRRRLRKLKNAD